MNKKIKETNTITLSFQKINISSLLQWKSFSSLTHSSITAFRASVCLSLNLFWTCVFVGLTVAKNVGSRVHTINGTRVDVSFHPSTRETQSQETSADQVRLDVRLAYSPLQKHERTWKEYGCFPFVWKTKLLKWKIN